MTTNGWNFYPVRNKVNLMKKTERNRLLAALSLVLLDGLAMALFQRFPSFFFPAYRSFSKQWIALLAKLVSFSPAAVWDIALPILVLAAVITLVIQVRKKRFINWLTAVLLIASILLSEVILGWMLNHYAPPLAEELGYEVTLYGSDELYETCEYFLKEASRYAPRMERDEQGHLQRQNF